VPSFSFTRSQEPESPTTVSRSPRRAWPTISAEVEASARMLSVLTLTSTVPAACSSAEAGAGAGATGRGSGAGAGAGTLPPHAARNRHAAIAI
jgi:hypothetical protein